MKILTALLWALLVASALILAYGASPAEVYGLMLARTWGDGYGLGQVVFRATPLVFTGLAVALAFHGGLFNIGAEGQLAVGSLACALAGAALPLALPAPLAVLACAVAAAVAGGALAALPGALKARFGAHEVISTIMLNFVAQAFVIGVGRRGLFLHETVHTAPVVAAARLPTFGAGTAASAACFLALAAALGCELLVRRTRLGFELRALGKSAPAAEAAGVRVGATTVWAMTLSGALAGLVGTATVLGYKGYYEAGLGSGVGFMGIAVALLARNAPWAIVPAALFLGTLAQGALAANAIVPKEIVDVIQGVIIFALALGGRSPRARPKARRDATFERGAAERAGAQSRREGAQRP
jgi:simple sugar transport system permease protein